MARPRKAAAPDDGAATIKLSYTIPDSVVCPFLGVPLTVIHNEQMDKWRAIGAFYYTKWFNTKQEMMHCLYTRDGKVPPFPDRVIQGMRLREPSEVPEGPDPVTVEAKERDEMATAYADEAVEVIRRMGK